MLRKLKTFIAVAGLSGTLLGTVSATAHAETVTIKKGDTLWDLSRVHNTPVETIKKLNHLTSDVIYPKEVLTLSKANGSKFSYKVKKGDNLWDLAKAHHVKVSQLKKWNKLKSDKILPGKILVFKDGATAPATKTSKKSGQAIKAKTKKAKKKITVKATAYTASCAGCSGTTATGINLKRNPKKKVIAVDPSVIPLGSKVYVQGYGEAIAADTGGAIKGNRIDVFTPSQKDAIDFGVKKLNVTILS